MKGVRGRLSLEHEDTHRRGSRVLALGHPDKRGKVVSPIIACRFDQKTFEMIRIMAAKERRPFAAMVRKLVAQSLVNGV
jgi:hypothetical protein